MKYDNHLKSSVGQPICSSYAIKPMPEVVKSVQTGVVENGETKGRQ
jgi:hypothetical protein